MKKEQRKRSKYITKKWVVLPGGIQSPLSQYEGKKLPPGARIVEKSVEREKLLSGCELTFKEAVEAICRGMAGCARPDIVAIPVDGITRYVCKGPGKTCSRCKNRDSKENLTARWRKQKFGY